MRVLLPEPAASLYQVDTVVQLPSRAFTGKAC
jgi:hypothetical protein